ncbi:dihydroneopterin aldolase [Coralloluteibacterium stylophorae]|uniref:dihydroneopterin aldolase n=1 Tax=Coralloluteibacterium stylophorae TaxID=1776034 RepID=A0A8J7VSA5_9GAMM|nr:dihydroneopterin aldolase [Coralloluteibacterium stylophorae]
MSDRVYIQGLALSTVIGVHAWERARPQALHVDVEFECDNRIPAASDAVADALDYAAVADLLHRLAGERRDALLETFAEACAGALHQAFGPRRLRLRIHKPLAAAALGCERVGVEIVRETPAA